MAATVAITGFLILGVAFLVRFLIAIHQELRRRPKTAVVRVPDSSASGTRIERPAPGVAHAIATYQPPNGQDDSFADQRLGSSINIRLLAWLLALLLGCVTAVAAQETVYNVPSGDVLDRGKVYFELDATYMPRTALRSFTPRIVVGVGRGTEIGLNVNGLSAPGDPQTTLTPTIKWKAYD